MSNIMKLNNAKETIIKQLITGSGGLFVGGSLITGLVLWANTWGVQFFDGSEYDFGVIRWFGYVSMVFIVGLIIHIQFVEALTAQEVFWRSVKYSAFAGILSLFIFGSLSLLVDEVGIFKGEIIVSLSVFAVIGLTVGGTQALRLKFENFDPMEHRALIGNEANIEACRENKLPYRHKVVGFWNVFGSALICCVLIAALLLVITSQNSDWGIVALMLIGLLAVFVFETSRQLGFVQDSRFTKISGEIKKDSWCTGRGVHFGLICDNRKLFLDSETWEEIMDGQKYILWYSTYGTPIGSDFVGRVLAFEYWF